jgi:predicted DNA-binding transcriptional regulator AlpA
MRLDEHTLDQHSLGKFWTLDEVADLLRMSPNALYTIRCRGGGPPGIKIGRRVLFREDELAQWLDDRRRPSPENPDA